MTKSAGPAPAQDAAPASIALGGDPFLIITSAASATAAVAIGGNYENLGLALATSALLLSACGAAFAWARGTACNVGLVAVHIPLGAERSTGISASSYSSDGCWSTGIGARRCSQHDG